MTTNWRAPSSARPRHFAFAMLEVETQEERRSIAALAPSEWHALIWTHYTLLSTHPKAASFGGRQGDDHDARR